MVDVVNSANNNAVVVKSKPIVGVVTPPDSNTRAGYYSDVEASKKFRLLNDELCKADQKVDYNDKKKTYTGLILTIGIVATGLLLMQKKVVAKLKDFNIKDAFKNFSFSNLKTIFKRNP